MAGEFERHLARHQHRIQILEQQLSSNRLLVRLLLLAQPLWLGALVFLAVNLFNVRITVDSDAAAEAAAEAVQAPVMVLPTPKLEPEPEPEPVVEPAPETAAATGVEALVKSGWEAADRDISYAEDQFRQAISQRPSHALANYGYAYVLLEQGRKVTAQAPLCTAIYAARGDTEMSRELEALRKRHDMSCR